MSNKRNADEFERRNETLQYEFEALQAKMVLRLTQTQKKRRIYHYVLLSFINFIRPEYIYIVNLC